MPNIRSRKLVNPLAVTARASALNAALSPALAVDKTDTLVRIIADRITFTVASCRWRVKNKFAA